MRRLLRTGSGWRLGLVTSLIALLGSFSSNAATYKIVDQTFDPCPEGVPYGWGDETVQNLQRAYVNEGVGRSGASQMSATLVDQGSGVTLALFQRLAVGGNELATRDNTVLSFDIKIDRPGMVSVGMLLDGWAGYLYDFWAYDRENFTDSLGQIPLGAYTPGVFKKIVVGLNDPLWQQDPWPDPNAMAPLFEPNSRTYNNITLIVNATSLPGLGDFKVTIDNVQVSTKNAMIPFEGTGTGTIEMRPDGWGVTERGVAEHLGNYEASVTVPFDWTPSSFELRTASGDTLTGTFMGVDYGVLIEQGTGRFEGIVGSFWGTLAWDPSGTSYTVKLRGALSTVGSNKK